MKNQILKVKSITKLTHDVFQVVLEKPEGIQFQPGQATELAINKPGWEKEGRPFTFTRLPEEEVLEFTIKSYTDHNGVTNELQNLKPGEEVILNDIFGAIAYKGKGTFIAGGAGLTPMLCILRDLQSKNKIGGHKLLFANKKQEDIILKEELQEMLGDNFINILSDEKVEGFANGFIDGDFIKENATSLEEYFYLCGPEPMQKAVEGHLQKLGVSKDQIIKEQ